MRHVLGDARRALRLGWVGLRIFVTLTIHSLLGRPALRRRRAILIREALEELGLTFVKLGQFMALRFDVLAPETCEELQKLFDKVTPLGFDEVRRVIEQELKQPLESIYPDFDPEPIAAASVAQVHAARLPSGKRVAVKVQRPGIRSAFEADIRLLYAIAVMVDLFNPSSQPSQGQFVLEFRSWTLKETDFTLEGRLADRFRRNVLPFEIIPKAYWDLTTDKVLTLQFIEGLNLARVHELYQEGGVALVREHLPGIDLDLAMHHFAFALLNQLFSTGLFHGDPHPGNLIVCQDSAVAFVDFGIVGELTPLQRRLLRSYYESFAMGDIDRSVDVYTRLWQPSEETDLAAYKREIRSILQDWYEKITDPSSSLKELHWGDFAEQSSAMVRRHGLHMSTDLLLFHRAIGILHASLLMMSVNMITEMEAFFQESVAGPLRDHDLVLGATRKWGPPLSDDARLAPARLSNLLKRLASAELQLPVRLHESPSARRAANTRAKALATALVGLSAAVLASRPEAGATACVLLTGASTALFLLALVGTRRL